MASKARYILAKVAEELGLFSIVQSSRDTKLLCLQRFIRLLAYGGSTLILALFLASVGSSDARIGLFMTLTLLGDVVISFILTLVADGLGRRRILMLGAALMSASGVIFSLSGNYWVLVMASIFGVISPRYMPQYKYSTTVDADYHLVATRLAHLEQLRSPPLRSSRRKTFAATFLPGIQCSAMWARRAVPSRLDG